MKKVFRQLKAGEELIISNGILWDACCDCGLVHRRVFKVKMLKFKGDKKPLPTVTMRVYPADQKTEWQRKHHKQIFILNPDLTVGDLRGNGRKTH